MQNHTHCCRLKEKLGEMAVRCVKHELTQVARGIGVAKSAAWRCIPRPAKSVKLNPVVFLPPDSSSVFEHSVQHDATNNPVLIYVFDCSVLFAAHVTAHADSFKESLKPVIPSLMHRLSSIQPLSADPRGWVMLQTSLRRES